ncbi:histone-like nucleoid-structuring protein Lsr2 [Segniliparus rugosus]|uniref:Lsr2 protein n=1 Tax=Segniliparus rugosus (strain ATCC BAA-974 / DSM 45345 / CCUG 50838 / CIP 108380 / JCM 13579 / CDC 945) TaxID=679197 RepID=E5XRV0_SEGRC|nr:Lsr2 family protein [Segniliparus rugosus]EFV12965.1 hypothetical protein HMPREF9336_02222 [Segniliparus rugosus ATCC BAA-974]
MAKKVIVTMVDDTDNTLTADETVSFGLDGASYTIDLSALNAAKFRDQLEPWVASATKVSGARGRKAVSATQKNSSEKLAAIRNWASKNGYEVSPRGRVPANVISAYEAASA